MLKLIVLAIVTSSLFAVNAEVQKGDVVVSLNTKEVSLSKGKSIELEEGTNICFVSGNGTVIVHTETLKQLTQPNRCLVIPIEKSIAENLFKDMKNKFTIAFWDSSESVRHGTGTKGKTEYESNGDFIVKKNQEELVLSGEFGPLNVTVRLLEGDKKILVFENEDSDITIVRIAKEKLKTGMRLEVKNGYGVVLLSKRIVVE